MDMTILVDSREQKPWDFSGYATSDLSIHTVRCALNIGDYSLLDYPNLAIERKSLNDLIGTLSSNTRRERFKQEIFYRATARGVILIVVIEGSIADVLQKKYNWGTHPHSILMTCQHWSRYWGIPFIWCGNRSTAQQYAFMTLSIYQQKMQKGLIGCLSKTQKGKLKNA